MNTTQTQVRSTDEALSVFDTLKLALEALERNVQHKYPLEQNKAIQLGQEAITAIKEALMSLCDGAQQEGQSNYCLQCEALSRELAALKAQQSNEQSKCNHTKTITRADSDGNPIETTCGECGERVAIKYASKAERDLYEMEDEDDTAPYVATPLPQRIWEGLSVFEINDLVENTEYEDYRDLVERTEAKLKEKNT